eukprot:3897805-Amphidinium_carterae.1
MALLFKPANGNKAISEAQGLHIIRLCLLSKHIHLLRALDPALTSAWCHQLDGAVEDSFTKITDIPIATSPTALSIFRAPLSTGGL